MIQPPISSNFVLAECMNEPSGSGWGRGVALCWTVETTGGFKELVNASFLSLDHER